MLCYTILYYTILYYTLRYDTIRYGTVRYDTIRYLLYYTLLYSTLLGTKSGLLNRCLSQGIPLNMTGVASLLKRGGYQTHLVGKWDVGMATEAHHPRARGYDSWLGYWHHTNDSRTLWWAKLMGFIFWRFSECFACFPIATWDVILSWCFLCAKIL